MAKWTVGFREEIYYTFEVEADSAQDAKEKTIYKIANDYDMRTDWQEVGSDFVTTHVSLNGERI